MAPQKTTAGDIPSGDPLARADYRKGVKCLVDTTPYLHELPSEYVLPLIRNPLLAGQGTIPVVDLSGLDGQIERRLFTVKAISFACAEWGFFRIINHGIKVSLMEEMIEVVKGFFDLPWQDKMIYGSDDVMNPVRYGTSLNTSINHNLHWRDYLRHYAHPIQNTFHLWPHNPPNYRNVAKQYLEEVWELAMKIAGAISEGLGLERKYIEESMGQGCQIMASNYYPPCPQPEKTLGLSAHSDHGGLTVLMQNQIDGLQVKYHDNWVSVPNVPGSFVVNIGDYLEILSNGRYKSVEHRAVVNKESTRISIAVGHGPELTAPVKPAGPLVNEKSEIKYMPIIYKDYMRLQQSSAIRGKSPLQAIMTNNNNSLENVSPISSSQQV